MKTEWDYTDLAKAYLKRPDYSDAAIDKMLSVMSVDNGDSACDIGAGVAHLTLKLLERGMKVVSVEPNDEMRKYGTMRTERYPGIQWFEGTGEKTGQPDNAFDIATFGSSFNVTDRSAAMQETARILKATGWFAVMWNHRDLNDPIQISIENIIKEKIPNYNYGTRREDQTEIINKSGLFGEVIKIEGTLTHVQTVKEVLEAWRSHGTLHRQAGSQFVEIIDAIEHVLTALGKESIEIPYTTRIWAAQLN